MENIIQQEEISINWLSAVGKFFEILRLLYNAVSRKGGDISHIEVLLRDKGLNEAFSDVLLGAAEVQFRDPVEVITKTGKTEKVKINATFQLKTDKQCLSLLHPEISIALANALLKRVGDKKAIYRWWKKIPEDQKRSWALTEGIYDPQLVQTIFDAMDDETLFEIYTNSLNKDGTHTMEATYTLRALKSEELLKHIAKSSVHWVLINAAISQISDRDFLGDLINEYYKPHPDERNGNVIAALRQRIEQVKAM